jgi:hypothetical protein
LHNWSSKFASSFDLGPSTWDQNSLLFSQVQDQNDLLDDSADDSADDEAGDFSDDEPDTALLMHDEYLSSLLAAAAADEKFVSSLHADEQHHPPISTTPHATGIRPDFAAGFYDKDKWDVARNHGDGTVTLTNRQSDNYFTVPVSRVNKALLVLDDRVISSDLQRSSQVCRCNRACSSHFNAAQLTALRLSLMQAPTEAQAVILIARWLTASLPANTPVDDRTKFKYFIDKREVCSSFFGLACRVARSKLATARHAAENGCKVVRPTPVLSANLQLTRSAAWWKLYTDSTCQVATSTHVQSRARKTHTGSPTHTHKHPHPHTPTHPHADCVRHCVAASQQLGDEGLIRNALQAMSAQERPSPEGSVAFQLQEGNEV